VCRAEEGHATSFMCTYHGWTYDLKGALVGVPGFKEVYHEELDREKWGLISAGQVDSYKGFVFATMDPEAPALYDFLGEGGRWGVDLIADKGDMTIIPGVEKSTINSNWKFPTDNTPDFYHSPIGPSHSSAAMAGWLGGSQSAKQKRNPAFGLRNTAQSDFIVVLSEYGHGLATIIRPVEDPVPPEDKLNQWRNDPEIRGRFSDLQLKIGGGMLNLFPNLFVPSGSLQVAIRMPKGPTKSEIWYFSFVDKNAPEDERKARQHRAAHTFGASGMLEQDDGENWDQSTRGVRGIVSGRYPLHYAMGKGHGDIIKDEDGPPRIESKVNEHAQLWTYRAWSEFMAARNWDDLRSNHSSIPEVL
jgi:phenylpropionate dioxygenase-like ring-hydroxylating dioxygenase large terminal subunit